MASKHAGIKTKKLRGITTVSRHGREIGRVSPHGYAGMHHIALARTTMGYMHLGVHTSRKAAIDHVASSFHPKMHGTNPTAKLKRPRSIFKIRTHPTQSLGV